MRILFCNKYSVPFSGTEVYLFELMELLRSRGHDVALFSMAEDAQQAANQYRTPFIDFKRAGALAKIKLAAHAIYSTDMRRRLRDAIADFRPDIAHVRNIYHHLSPSILWELHSHRIPVLYHVNDFKLICPTYNLVAHGEVCNECRGGQFWRAMTTGCYEGPHAASAVLVAEAYFHKWLRTYGTCVTKIVAPSEFARQKLVENGWDRGRIEVLHHFQKISWNIPSTLPEQASAVLYFGRLSQEKGLISLLIAARNLPSIPFVIAGQGPQREELEKMVEELRLSNIQFLGHVQGNTLAQALGASRFTVFPSLAYETLGKAILESYAAGRAVVASDLGPRRELVIPGKTGLLYGPGNTEQLSDAIQSLYTQPLLAREMGLAGRDLVQQRHSPEKYHDALLEIYREMMGKRSARAKVGRSDRPLRIAFIGGRGLVGKYSGIESYYEEVGRRLAEMGHEVTVYCRSYFTPDRKRHNAMRILCLPCIRTKHLETLSHTLLSTAHAAFGPYDIVHYHTLGPALFSFFPRLTGKKTVVTVQGLDWQRKKWGKLASSVLQIGEWAAIRLPHATTVVSRTLQDYYRSKYRLVPSFIPNGTDLRVRSAPHYLSDWGLEPGRYVLFMGRFSPEKNCDLLVRAFEHTRSQAKLVLAGGAGYSDAYVQALYQKRSDRVRVLEWVSGEARDELLTNAMLFVMPSDLEGLSLALLEAMGAGVCVLTSDVPENREVVADAGFTFRMGDEQDLSRMLQLLISNDELRSTAARKCQQRVRENYLWPEVTRQIEREYLRVMGRHNDAAEKQHSAKAA
jgi:glycosyltransferase involved in cell wall biosynthesis